MKTKCEWCGEWFEVAPKGRLPRFCSSSCRGKNHRAKAPKFPTKMRAAARWVRAAGKRPITVAGRPASSTDAGTWSSWRDVQRSRMGDGLGFMLGGGIGCYDIDGASDERAREVIAGIREPIVFVERSISGNGFHVFVEMPESRGSVHQGVDYTVERYSFGRFIRMTGEVFV